MNKVVLIGRLVRDPELKFTPGAGTAVARFTLAVDRRFPSKDGQREADFIPVVAFGKTAETIANYVSKGKLIAVSGRVQTGSYDAADGTKRYTTDIILEDFQFLEKKGAERNNGGYSESSVNYNPGSSSSGFDDYISPVDDDEIPF